MTIPKKKLEELVAKYEKQADQAYRNYQETGITRYDTARRTAEDLADTLRIALNSKDEHDALVHFKGTISSLASAARGAHTPEAKDRVLRSLIAFAEMQGLIQRDDSISKSGTK